MSKRAKTLLIKYGSCAVFVGVMLAWFLSRVDWEKDGLDVVLRMTCDGLTIPGVLLLCFGALVFCTNEGALDGISYALRSSAHMFVPASRRKPMRYSEYVEERKGKRVKGYGFLLISGAVTMGLALIVWIIYSVI